MCFFLKIKIKKIKKERQVHTNDASIVNEDMHSLCLAAMLINAIKRSK